VTPPAPVVGLVSAGEMGSALGAALRRGGATVLTSVVGRSDRTRGLAERAGLELVDGLDEVVGRSAVLLSVVPPQDAVPAGRDLVDRARAAGVRPLVVDLNAVAPTDVVGLAGRAADAGLPFVDGALSGAPPGTSERRTRLLLCGPAAAEVAALPWTDVAVTVVGDRIGAASAAKMCTGGVRKGTTALLINALVTAAEYGVLEPVAAELRRALGRDPSVEVELAASKAWRFVPEMEAVADTQASAGLDPAAYRAIAEVFRRTADSPLAVVRPEDVDRSDGDPAARLASLAAKLRAR
jgi:3-hydroxyisobutyrate dehydrogenase-like beta-hydroxyacid dehydrogenase